MPSVESKALTYAIRSAMESRSSSYHAPGSYGPTKFSPKDLPSIEYDIKLTWKHIPGDDKDFDNFLLANNAEVFVLDTQAIKSEVCIAPELMFARRKIVRAVWVCSGNKQCKDGNYYEEWLPIKLDDGSSHTIYSYRYGSERDVVFYDENTFGVYARGDDNRLFISKSKDSIKKLINDIFATAKFKRESIKELTYNALMKLIDQ